MGTQPKVCLTPSRVSSSDTEKKAARGISYLVLGYVCAAALHSDARLEVVEVSAVELKELQQEDAQVDLSVTTRLQTGVQLKCWGNNCTKHACYHVIHRI